MEGSQVGSMLRSCSRGLLGPNMDPILALIWAQHGLDEPLQIAEIGACGEQKDLRCACPAGQEGALVTGSALALGVVSCFGR